MSVVTALDLVVEMRFGSHLYGTETPASDLDIKGVFVPSADDILLQRVPPNVSAARAKEPGERNRPGDVDREYFSLQRYLALLAAGQTLAIDMLFAPDAAMIRPPAALWLEIRAAAPRLVTKRATAFLRYCRQQADRYGIKGSRLAAARGAVSVLADAEARLGSTAKLGEAADAIAALCRDQEHLAVMEIEMPGGRMLRHLEICGRKVPFTAAIKLAAEIAARVVAEYGERSRQAETDRGVDWKALSHAVRVGREAVELLRTGRIVFPLAGAAHLRRIKAGELGYAAVVDEIERLLAEVESASAASSLPDEADRAWIDALVRRVHLARILAAGRA